MSVNPLSSKLINNRSTHTNFPPTHFQPTPTGGENFLARFYTFKIFFKNVPDYRNRSNFARGPNSTHSSIWEKNIWGSEKKAHSLFSGPKYETVRWSFLILSRLNSVTSYSSVKFNLGRTGYRIFLKFLLRIVQIWTILHNTKICKFLSFSEHL